VLNLIIKKHISDDVVILMSVLVNTQEVCSDSHFCVSDTTTGDKWHSCRRLDIIITVQDTDLKAE